MGKMKDGSVVSSYFQITDRMSGKDIKNLGSQTVLGQIKKVHFTDDPTNVSKRYVEYDVNVINDKGGLTTLKNVKSEATLGGFNDHDEVIMEPSEAALQGKLSDANTFDNMNGMLVHVSFRDDSFDKPYISGAVDHPRRIGPTRDKGIHRSGEFRGFQWEINKLGEFTVTYNGDKNPKGELTRPDTGPTQVKIDSQGRILVTDNNKQSIVMDRVAGTITLTNTEGKVFKLDTVQRLGEGTEPVVLGDTLFDMLNDFLTTIIAGILPGGPGHNAQSLVVIRDAAQTLQGVLEDFKSENSRTD